MKLGYERCGASVLVELVEAAEQQHRRRLRRTRKRRRSEDKQEEKEESLVAGHGGPAEMAGGHANPRIDMDNRDNMDSTDEGHEYSTPPSCSSFDYSCFDLDTPIL
jgi:hypothetical protein